MSCQQFGCGGCGCDTRFLCSNCNSCSNCCSCGGDTGGGGGCCGGGGGGCCGGGGNGLPSMSPMPSMSALPNVPYLPNMSQSNSNSCVPCCGATVVHSYPDCCGMPRCPDVSHPCPWPWYKRVFIPGCPVVPGYRGHIPGIRLHGAGRTFGDATRDTCCIMGQWGNCCPFLPCRIFEQ